MKHDETDRPLDAIAALGDPLRRRLYRFVSAQNHAVSRDEAAEDAEVTRSAAAFHLDRLVHDGLLEVEFRRLSGRQGPGAGRPAKLYRRARTQIAVSLPARQYELAAALLASAVSEAGDTGAPVETVLGRLAHEYGGRLAARAASTGVTEALAGEGYEPRAAEGEIVLANCPFHALVADNPRLVCHMNQALLEGFAGGLPEIGMRAELRPSDDACCVRLALDRP